MGAGSYQSPGAESTSGWSSGDVIDRRRSGPYYALVMEPTDLAPSPPGGYLRIAILLDRFEQPRWVYRTIEHLQTTGLGKIVLVVRTPPSKNDRGVWWRIAHLGYLVHTALDDWYFGRESDALTRTSLDPLLSGIEVVEAPRHLSSNGRALDEIDLRGIENHRLDVALAFGPPPPGA